MAHDEQTPHPHDHSHDHGHDHAPDRGPVADLLSSIGESGISRRDDLVLELE